MTHNLNDQTVGANPAHVKWNVVRGDTASIVVQFLQNDEVTEYDTSSWTYISNAYYSKIDTLYPLTVEVTGSSVKLTASSDTTALWGTGLNDTVAELFFDLQVTIDGDTIWTPIIGNITVLGDISGAL
jgi:hypothetical protein